MLFRDAVLRCRMNDADARITRLEERYTHLQKHVTEQDRVILGLTEQIERVQRDLLRLQAERATGRAGEGDDLPADERPPHY